MTACPQTPSDQRARHGNRKQQKDNKRGKKSAGDADERHDEIDGVSLFFSCLSKASTVTSAEQITVGNPLSDFFFLKEEKQKGEKDEESEWH